ncbi:MULTISPECIES: SCO family protein [unclassified Spirosoma]|uniref:SCO family protein n=1 Tax=unclassified Spirosoma TaxID=2621999 RepID=UPI0009640DFD|nr:MULTISPECIES: SCO family protein [unclassified Spirosoma]MBN8824331.1 SCO family protein [Spirosoma sp.]OJW70202.1 MAG: SCO family protein [Spirosoma sp. 48-14]
MKFRCACISLLLLFGLSQCSQTTEKLPYIGEPETVTNLVDGNEVTGRGYPVIPAFSFINQYGKTVTQQDFDGKIYVADFFFVTCPTICPIMKKNLLEVYKKYKDSPDVRILSHTIDPDHDTPVVLGEYVRELGITGTMWQFVTGDREKIYDIGENHYLVTAGKDAKAPGGYIHSGAFVLIDREKHIRGMYDGTTQEGTQKLIRDINVLRQEYE